uniref:MPN domain-containing protein n=1 Tax=Globisporangium ultimum (strain ATCC 200006 / CBS 805.95 / DAOM BR144) TaxID=431595 RepID=K3X3W2_GLOUD
MGDYHVEASAYVKLLLHAAKYPTSACNGLLVGEEQGQGFVVTDAVPLFHHDAPLAPVLEVACAMVDAWCQTQPSKKIVGYYHAGEFGSESAAALNVFGEKVADKVEANCSRACVLLVENNQLNSEAKSAVQLLLKDVKRGWIRVDNRLRLRNTSDDKTPMQVFSAALQQNAFEELADFDEHLDDVSKDWRNPNLLQLIKFNV